MAKIIANGISTEIDQPCRLANSLKQSGWKPTQVVVELNGEVVPRMQLEDVKLFEGDRLEVILPVAGG